MSDQPDKLSPAELINRIAARDAPAIFDVRKQPAFMESGQMLPDALKMNHETIADDLDIATGTPIVVYCVHGHEVSQGAAISLQQVGHDAVYLEGGIEGYIEAGGRTVPAVSEAETE